MELRHLFILLRRWFWLLLLGAAAGGAAGYFWSQSQPSVYQASTKVLILGTNELDELSRRASTEELIRTYTQLLLTRPVLNATSERLGYGVSGGQISVRQVPRTRMFQVTVQGPGQQQVADTANTLVDVLIEQNDILQSSRFASSASGLESQLTDVEAQISQIEAEISAIAAASRAEQVTQLEEQIASLETTVTNLNRDIFNLRAGAADEDGNVNLSLAEQATIAEKEAELAALKQELSQYRGAYIDLAILGSAPSRAGDQSVRLNQLNTQLDLYQDIYTSLLSDYETTRLANLNETPNVVQVDLAVPPLNAIQPRPVETALMTGALGLLLAIAVAFVVEYQDNTIKSDETIKRFTKAPIISHILNLDRRNRRPTVNALQSPRSPFAESFRALRTNLEFSGIDQPLKSILITSAGPAEGKSTVVANLAAVFAQAGQHVIVVDADLRKPRLHDFYDLPQPEGLTDALLDIEMLRSLLKTVPENEYIRVLTSGVLPPNPAELLRTGRMSQVLDRLTGMADLVLVDGPPLVVADPIVLATKVDGVVTIVRHATSDVNAVAAMFMQLERARARLIGVVVNGVDVSAYGNYYTYQAYRSYYGRSSRLPRLGLGWVSRSNRNGHDRSNGRAASGEEETDQAAKRE